MLETVRGNKLQSLVHSSTRLTPRIAAHEKRVVVGVMPECRNNLFRKAKWAELRGLLPSDSTYEEA
jgi:hypothetical protein